MEQGLWLQLKMLFLLGYNLKIAISGVGGGEVRFSRWGVMSEFSAARRIGETLY